jgi:hypothetical protein
MTTVPEFDLQVANWSFGRVPPDQLPAVAREALAKGIDSPSLRKLADNSPEPNPDLDTLFERALAELGRSRLPRAEAGRIIARDFARRLCDGSLPPVEGATAIWHLGLDCEELEREFGIFGGLVSELDGVWELEGVITEQIIEEARYLLQESR